MNSRSTQPRLIPWDWGKGADLPAAPVLPAGTPDAVVYGFNDVHGQVEDPARSPAAADWRASRCRSWQAARLAPSGHQPTLLLGAGDDHAGTWLDTGMTDSAAQADPVYGLYRAAGVDAITLGNHDLDWGPDPVRRVLTQSAPPCVASNLDPADPLATVTHRALIAEWPHHPWRIGILGLLTDDHTNPLPRLTPVETILSTALPRLFRSCHAVIVLSHLGWKKGKIEENSEFSDQKILNSWIHPRLLVLGAHSHDTIPDRAADPVESRYGQAGAGGAAFLEAGIPADGSAPIRVRVRTADPAPDGQPSPPLQAEEAAVRRRRDRWRAAFPPLRLPGDPSVRRLLAQDSTARAYRSASPTLVLMAEAVRQVLPADITADSWVCIDVRAWSGRPLTDSLDFFGWHACLPYPDEAQLLEIPAEALHPLIEAMEQRRLGPPTFQRDAGRWQGDRRLAWSVDQESGDRLAVRDLSYAGRPWSAFSKKRIKLISSAFVCRGFGGNWQLFEQAGLSLEQCRLQRLDRPFRDLVRDGLDPGFRAKASGA